MSLTLKEKQSNYEFMRILSMFMIVFWHVIGNNVPIGSLNSSLSFCFKFIQTCIVVHVNSFVLLSGYFSTGKTTTWRKGLSIFFTSWFYRVVFACLLFFTAWVPLSHIQFFQEIMPFDLKNYWFINCYLVLLLLVPFLNILIHHMTERQHKYLLFVSFFLFSIVPFLTSQATVSNDGYTVIQFIFLYFLGAYLKKYPIAQNYHFKSWSKNKLQLLFVFLFFGCFLTNFMLSYFSNDLIQMNNSILNHIGTTLNSSLLNYSNPLVMIQSVSFFLFFGTLTIKNKWINKISTLTFGVYLFHDNYYFKQIIYQPFHIGNYLNSYVLIPYCLLVAFILFCAGLLCEFLRTRLVSFLKKRKLVQKIFTKCENYVQEF